MAFDNATGRDYRCRNRSEGPPVHWIRPPAKFPELLKAPPEQVQWIQDHVMVPTKTLDDRLVLFDLAVLCEMYNSNGTCKADDFKSFYKVVVNATGHVVWVLTTPFSLLSTQWINRTAAMDMFRILDMTKGTLSAPLSPEVGVWHTRGWQDRQCHVSHDNQFNPYTDTVIALVLCKNPFALNQSKDWIDHIVEFHVHTGQRLRMWTPPITRPRQTHANSLFWDVDKGAIYYNSIALSSIWRLGDGMRDSFSTRWRWGAYGQFTLSDSFGNVGGIKWSKGNALLKGNRSSGVWSGDKSLCGGEHQHRCIRYLHNVQVVAYPARDRVSLAMFNNDNQLNHSGLEITDLPGRSVSSSRLLAACSPTLDGTLRQPSHTMSPGATARSALMVVYDLGMLFSERSEVFYPYPLVKVLSRNTTVTTVAVWSSYRVQWAVPGTVFLLLPSSDHLPPLKASPGSASPGAPPSPEIPP
eukprot:gene8148-1456_t